MSPLEVQKIIELLADGIDPETGEVLPEQCTLNNPQVIRALHVAKEALARVAKQAERRQSLPASAGLPWSDDEDRVVVARFESGAPIKEIAAAHGRTEGAIVSRLIRLGKIKDASEVYPNGQAPEAERPALDERDEALFDALKKVRLKIAIAKGLPAYMICQNASLEDMARLKPGSARDLLMVRGIGPGFVQNYGEIFLSAISEHISNGTTTEATPHVV